MEEDLFNFNIAGILGVVNGVWAGFGSSTFCTKNFLKFLHEFLSQKGLLKRLYSGGIFFSFGKINKKRPLSSAQTNKAVF